MTQSGRAAFSSFFAFATAETASFAALMLCRMPFGLIERDRPMISMASSG